MQQTTDSLLMVYPEDFTFNLETSVDNEFQQAPQKGENLTQAAIKEFNTMVKTLQLAGINIHVMRKQDNFVTPDAIFPNNWFATRPDGRIWLFPMKAANRRLEVRPHALSDLLAQTFDVNAVSYLGLPNESAHFLEGTGVLVHDHPRKRVYAALSERCHSEQLSRFAALDKQEEIIAFNTKTSSGTQVYHTNVLMSVGKNLAIVCDDVIVEKDRASVLSTLSQHHEVISITEAQMQAFCGNVLEVKNTAGEAIFVMSQTAFNAFSPEQRQTIKTHGKLLPVDIHHIEKAGGGSARCMLAEIFLSSKVN